MKISKRLRQLVIAAFACMAAAQAAHAQVPVTVTSDIPATMNQIETILKWTDQLSAMGKQLDQMKQVYGTLQGTRNMGNVLNSDLLTQYLPEDYVSAARSLGGGSGAFAGISSAVDGIVRANQIRSCAELNADATLRNQCTQQWQQLALQKQVGDLAYRKAAQNIRNLQTFIGSINASSDQKAIAEVQARIQIETVRMQNEQVKLSTIQSMQQADRQLRQQAVSDSFNASLNRGAAGGIRF